MPRFVHTNVSHNRCFYYSTDSEEDEVENDNLQPLGNPNYNDQPADTTNSQLKTDADSNSNPIQNNLISIQPNPNCPADLKLTHNCLANFQYDEISSTIMTRNSDTQNCNDTRQLPHNPVDLQENQDSGQCNSIDNKSKSCNDSSFMEEQNSPADTQHTENCLTDSKFENDLNIKAALCDKDSDSDTTKVCSGHSQFRNELSGKSELYDANSDSDRSMSDSTKETESLSDSFERSNDVCGSEFNHSSNSVFMEIESEKNEIAEYSTDSIPNQDLKRSRRNSKRKREADDHCPVCSLTIRCSELENHFAKEVENLSNIAKNVRKHRTPYKQREGFKCGVSLAFLQAKQNREDRLQAKQTKYTKKNTVTCPGCKMLISGTDEEINDHILICFREDDDSDINVTDYDENFEEYEIGNETRIRVISLVPGGHSALHGCSSQSKPTKDEDDGVDINVDVDDTIAFGDPQYTELDVIHSTDSSSNTQSEQLRQAVVSDLNAEPIVIESKKWSTNFEIQNEIDKIISSCSKSNSEELKPKENKVQLTKDVKEKTNDQNTESGVISALKKRIKDLEDQRDVKCLICLEPYTTPVVSTTCWHVHCEECWLVSMGVKKLCPQCNMIVFPTDLRRIYL